MNNLVPFSKVDLVVEMFDKEWGAQHYFVLYWWISMLVDGAILLFIIALLVVEGFLLGWLAKLGGLFGLWWLSIPLVLLTMEFIAMLVPKYNKVYLFTTNKKH